MRIPRLNQTASLAFLLLRACLAAGNSTTLDFFTTTDGATYAYEYTPAQGANATFLLIHGYPSTHNDWAPQVAALTAEGYGVLAPDMLGFGASDMPTEVEAYRLKRLAGHYTELLDHEEIQTVIGVGHDWGSGMLSRLAAYHQDRFDKFVYLNVGHQAPGGFFDLDAVNAFTAAEYGYTTYGYWYFFTRYDAGSVIRDHLESYFHIVFPETHETWITDFAPLGAVRAWLNADTKAETPPFIDVAYEEEWFSWMSRPNATEAGLNYYKALIYGYNDADETALTNGDWKLRVPVLTIAGAFDYVARPEFMESTRDWSTAGYENKVLDGGHWLSKEVPEEVSKLLIEFGQS